MRDLLKCRVIVFLIICIAIILGINYVTEPRYLPYANDVVYIYSQDKETVLSYFSEKVAGYDISKYSEDGISYTYHITAWDNIWNRFVNNGIDLVTLNPNGEKITSIYYYTADMSDDILIYGGSSTGNNGGVVTLPRLFLAGYLRIAIILIAICLTVLLSVLNNERRKSIVEKVLFIPIAYIIGTFFIKGFTISSYSAARDFFVILVISFPIYFLLLTSTNLYKQCKHKN